MLKKYFSYWHKKASVSSINNNSVYEKNLCEEEICVEGSVSCFFPKSLIPFSLDQFSQTQKRNIEIVFLRKHIEFTKRLEISLVNPTLELLINNQVASFYSVNSELKSNLLKIYVDEAYHASFCFELNALVENSKYFIDLPVMVPPMFMKFEGIYRDVRQDPRTFFTRVLAYAFVSENIITQDLMEICKSNLKHQVLSLFKLHARDEVFHSILFQQIVKDFLREMPFKFSEFKREVDFFVKEYCRASFSWHFSEFEFLGLSPADLSATRIETESYIQQAVQRAQLAIENILTLAEVSCYGS